MKGPDPDSNPDEVGQYNPEHRDPGHVQVVLPYLAKTAKVTVDSLLISWSVPL